MLRALHLRIGAIAMALATGVGCSPSTDATDSLLFETRIPLELQRELPVFIDAEGRAFLVDTGTPRSLVSAEVLGVPPRSDVEAIERTADEWELLQTWGVPRAEVLVVSQDYLDEIMGTLGAVGIIGADLLRTSGVVTFYLEGGYLQLGRPDFLADRAPIADVSGSLLGSGDVCWDDDCFPYAPSRWLTDVTLEGQKLTAMLDTGAGFLTVVEDVVDADRPTTVEIIDEQDTTRTLTRVDGLEAGAVHLVEPVVDLIPFTNRFVRLASQVGRPVDVLLGTLVLRQFIVVLDYGHGTMELYAAPDVDPDQVRIPEPFGVSFGLTPEPDGRCYRVSRLKVDGEAMTAGLAMGDCVLQVDDMGPQQQLTMPEITERLLGPEVGYAFPLVVEDEDEGQYTLLLHTEQFVPPA
ncbi:MAG: hypothetical protein K0V04_33815 [Deltaproteobacteria bacterium]|nr:hypothetical protein [Deltaproteobacteria bacterium]